jgi:hypothetical protein
VRQPASRRAFQIISTSSTLVKLSYSNFLAIMWNSPAT